jgi:mannose-6-phosphate isomerase
MDRLENTVRPYAWGSRTAIPALLGITPTGQPQAELWMGAHPGAPSSIDRGSGPRPLDQVIAADPASELGAANVARFGPTLPFLVKVLAAEQPLSLQVHPGLEQARAGYAAEKAAGLSQDPDTRNYKDPNHKPEMLCALGEFTGVCGFRDPAATAELLDRLGVPGLRAFAETLRARPEAEALREVLSHVLTLGRDTVSGLVAQTADALERLAGRVGQSAASDPEAPDSVMLRDYAALAALHPDDPGVLAALLLNHVRLRAGQALYLGAGVPHAYFRGLGVEVMANSDNVLRAGLTAKHIDVPELLRVVAFRSGRPRVVMPQPVPQSPGEEVYPAPIDEFRLSRYFLGSRLIPTDTPQILLCTDGRADLTDAAGARLVLSRGESCYIAAGAPSVIAAPCDRAATVYRATVGTTTAFDEH